MELLNVQLPVLIQASHQPDEEGLTAYLLGFPDFTAQADRAEEAFRRLRKSWTAALEDQQPPFHRLALAPRLSRARVQKIRVTWREKKERQEGLTWLLAMEENDRLFVQFPRISDSFFSLSKDQDPKSVLDSFLKPSGKTKKSGSFPKHYLAHPMDRLAWMDTAIPVSGAPLKWTRSYFDQPSVEQAIQEGREEIRRLGTCLNEDYPDKLSRSWMRDEEVAQLQALLFDEAHRPVIVVGPEKSGRHSLLSEVLYRYLEGKPSPPARRFWLVDPNRLISGMSIIGQWEQRLENLFFFLHRPSEAHRQPDLLILDQPLSLLRLGQTSNSKLSFADLLAAWLEKKLIKVVLIATPAQWNKMRERAPRFADLFLPFQLRSHSLEEAIPMLIRKKRDLEHKHGLEISVQAMQEFLQLYKQYLHPQPLPGALGHLMDQMARRFPEGDVRAAAVQQLFFEQQGMVRAQSFFFEEESSYSYRQRLEQGLKGQPKAVEALTQVLELIQAKCPPTGRPISTFLFVGPTGVGKTQAAKVLSEVLLGADSTLLRFDMNEYIDGTAGERLLGSWARPEGQLTSRVRFRPFGVLLLDEIEKAHPTVHDILLQVLDEGRLTDAGGRTTYFHNLVIIMTSNLGVDRAARTPSFDPPDAEEQDLRYLREVERFFRPEFVNRIDEIVVFQPLAPEHILQIAQLQMEELLQRDGFLRRTTLLSISREALEWVAKRGYDGEMGGRALKRQIERDLTALTAEQLLQLPTDTPVILEVILENNRLKPVLEALQFSPTLTGSWLPRLPGQRTGRFVGRLLQRVREMHAELSRSDGPMPLGEGKARWAFFHHKEKLAQLQEKLERLVLNPGQLHDQPAMRFNLASFYQEDELTHLRDAQVEDLLDRTVISQLAETYRLGTPIWDQQQGGLLEAWLDLQFLEQDQFAANQNQMDDLHFALKSRSNDLDPAAMQWLQEQYQSLFDALYLNASWNPKAHAFHLTGFGLRPLVEPEVGMHLFYAAHQSPTPVEVSLTDRETQESKRSSNIIRLYDNRQVLTDLRSGLSCSSPLSPAEWKVILYAGIKSAP